MVKTDTGFIDTEVIADIVTEDIPKSLRFTALADVDYSLKDTPGSTIKFPVYSYIGDAEETAPGEAVDPTSITTSTTSVKVKKATKAVSINDEDVLNAVGDPVEWTTDQITKSLTGKVDTDLRNELDKATLEAPSVNSVETLQDALVKFNDEEVEDYVIYLSVADELALSRDAGQNYLRGSNIGAEKFASGVVGEVQGVQVIVSNKVNEGDFYLVKRGALKLVIKREALIEEEREAKSGKTDIVGNVHYAPHLQRPDHVVKASNL